MSQTTRPERFRTTSSGSAATKPRRTSSKSRVSWNGRSARRAPALAAAVDRRSRLRAQRACSRPWRQSRSRARSERLLPFASSRESEPPSSSGPGRCPFKAVTAVRIRSGVRVPPARAARKARSCGAVWSARRPVKAEAAGSNPVRTAGWLAALQGRVAQSAEHTPEKRGVTGSTPVPATKRQGRSRPVRAPGSAKCCRGGDPRGSDLPGRGLAGRGFAGGGVRHAPSSADDADPSVRVATDRR